MLNRSIFISLLMLASSPSFAGIEIFKCNEPLEISNCEIKGHIGTCTYKNIAEVNYPDRLSAYTFNEGNVRVGMDYRINLIGLPPGQSKRDGFVIEGDEAKMVVLCTIDPSIAGELIHINDVKTKGILW